MGPKRSLVLAAVANVPESYANMKVLIELTSINEVEFKLSEDLKLINIVLGMQTHSSKYPCPYGQCCLDGSGSWVKGKDRTFASLSENQKSWCLKYGQNRQKRSKLKEYYNVEFQPIISPPDQDTPVISIIPPPPLHLLLLGRVQKIVL